MIRLYCRRKEGNKELCPQCLELLEYARMRLSRCPFGENKTTCRLCPVHCYKPEMKKRMQEVMRYAGPRPCCSIIRPQHAGIYGKSIYINISPDVSESRARNSISSKPLPGHTLLKKLPDLSVRPRLCPTHIRANALPARSRHKMPPPCIGGTPFCA